MELSFLALGLQIKKLKFGKKSEKFYHTANVLKYWVKTFLGHYMWAGKMCHHRYWRKNLFSAFFIETD